MLTVTGVGQNNRLRLQLSDLVNRHDKTAAHHNRELNKLRHSFAYDLQKRL